MKRQKFWGVRWLACFCCFLCATEPVLGGDISLNGQQYVELRSVAKRLGMKYHVIQAHHRVKLYQTGVTLEFTLHKNDFALNGTKVYLGMPVALSNTHLYITERDYESLIKPILAPEYSPDPPKLYHIVIDPGHGGKDQGAESGKYNIREKTLSLGVAERLKKKLEAKGYRVSLTRTTDVFVSLEDRARFARTVQADLFVSIHFNAAQNKKAAGIETYVLTLPMHPSSGRTQVVSADKKSYPSNRYDHWSTLAGFYVQRSLTHNTRTVDRGLKRARFAVLKDLNCPGMLVECGFLSNDLEAKSLSSSERLDQLAQQISEGIYTYQKTLNRVRNKS